MTRALVVIAAVIAACKGDRPRDPPGPSHGHASAPIDAAAGAIDARPALRHINDGASVACGVHDVELVYVVDSDRRLWAFDPKQLGDDPFRQVGVLDCESDTTPFSMAIDRTGIAWVLYNDGQVFRASIIDASCAPATATAGIADGILYGMGYVTDAPGSQTERLYVTRDDGTNTLAWLDTAQHPATWTTAAHLTGAHTSNPELTGTADAQLYGYFPEHGAGFVQEIDRRTGKLVGKRLEIDVRSGDVNAWAFAFWGGSFYVFTTIDSNSMVSVVDRKTGEHRIALEHLDMRIVGAGVSTCAPLMERPAEVEQPR